MSNFIDAALLYAQKGYFVFPCAPQSKVPATHHGFKDATTDEEQIREWWSENPDYNIGIPTGKVNGFWVLDIDSDDAWKEAVRRGYIPTVALYDEEGSRGTMPDACIVKTGRGFHVYFAYPEEAVNFPAKLNDEMHIKADGGYVMAAGSTHTNGKVYEYATARTEPTERPLRSF